MSFFFKLALLTFLASFFLDSYHVDAIKCVICQGQATFTTCRKHEVIHCPQRFDACLKREYLTRKESDGRPLFQFLCYDTKVEDVVGLGFSINGVCTEHSIDNSTRVKDCVCDDKDECNSATLPFPELKILALLVIQLVIIAATFGHG